MLGIALGVQPAVGGQVRDKYTAKNPLIADFYKQAQGL